MPIRKLFKLIFFIGGKKPADKKEGHQKYGFIILENEHYDYFAINIPDGYVIRLKELKESENIVECHPLTPEFTQKQLEKRVKLLNRRLRQQRKKSED